MENSPLHTLTLEDFLESERHKLSGTLTPVTPESFAKWKKERLDKKAAEEQAKKSKEDSGRALFEAGGFDVSDDEESDDEAEDDPYNLAAMRRETERVRAERESTRLEQEYGGGGDGGGEENMVNGTS